MKKLILTAVILLAIATGIAYAYCVVDQVCAMDCRDSGRGYAWCNQYCTVCN